MEGNGKTDNRFTKTEARILRLLADGQAHTRREIHACLWDEESALTAIQFHISKIRQALQPIGQTIVCELHNSRICYRHVILVTKP